MDDKGTDGSDPQDANAKDTEHMTDAAADAEIERLRRERDELEAELEAAKDTPRKRQRLRKVTAGVLVAIVILTFTATVPAAWARRTFFNTDRYVATVGPLISDPAVQQALTNEITDQVFKAVPVQTTIQNALPDQIKFLALPMTGAVRSFVHSEVGKLIKTQAFQNLWVNAQRFAQTQIVAVLNGNGTVVSVVGGKVVLNLLPLVNNVLGQVQTTISGLVGHTITLPTITAGELPDAARQKLSEALGVPIPATLGTIVIFKSDTLKTAQQAFAFINKAVVVLWILDVLLIVGALLVSVRRRRTLLQMMIGFAVGLVVVRALSRVLEGQLLNSFRLPANRAAAAAVAGAFLHSLLLYTGWLLVIVLVVALVAWVTGPYRWAERLRTKTVEVGRLVVGTVTGTIEGEGASGAWVRSHVTLLQIAGAVLAIVLLLWVSLSWWSFLLIVGLLALFELGLFRLGQQVATE